MAQHFSPDQKDSLDEMLLGWPDIEAGEMFGHPSYQIQGKVFASLMENGISLKMPPAVITNLLQQKNISPFMPIPGQVLRHWIFIQVDDSMDYADYGPYVEQALAFVAAETSDVGP